jgi:pimeloyl-ACP methyl ester carboxylesterase
LRATWPALARAWNYWGTVGLTFEQFYYALANTMSEVTAHSAYARYAIPGPTRTILQAAWASFSTTAAGRVNDHNHNRAPLLLIAGSEDRLAPPAVVRRNFEKYAYATAITDFKEFPTRSHLMIAQAGWHEVAQFALAWSQTQVRRALSRDWQFGSGVRRSSTTL